MTTASLAGTGAAIAAAGSDARRLYLCFIASFLLGIALLASLVLAAGFWELIADTRLLAALIEAGIIPLGEDDPGIGSGVPNVAIWIRSQEIVAWSLVVLAALVFVAVALLKGVQFHRMAHTQGIAGTLGQHMRAYLYGHGLERMLPFRAGEVAWAAALRDQGGATIAQGTRLAVLFRVFLLFELAVFALLGLVSSDMLTWALSLLPAILIFIVCWLVMRGIGGNTTGAVDYWREAGRLFAEQLRDPQMLGGLVLLSLISFFLVELASYIVPQAFATPVVLLVQNELRFVVVTVPVIVMTVVAGYIARLVPVTPGGIGQFEWGMALALWVNDLPMTQAIAIAFLISGVRYLTGAILFAATMMIWGIETNFRRVLALLDRSRPA